MSSQAARRRLVACARGQFGSLRLANESARRRLVDRHHHPHQANGGNVRSRRPMIARFAPIPDPRRRLVQGRGLVADLHQHVEQGEAPDAAFRIGDLVETRERFARAVEVAARRQHQPQPLGIVGRDDLVGEQGPQQGLLAVERAFQPVVGQQLAGGLHRRRQVEQLFERANLAPVCPARRRNASPAARRPRDRRRGRRRTPA